VLKAWQNLYSEFNQFNFNATVFNRGLEKKKQVVELSEGAQLYDLCKEPRKFRSTLKRVFT
jgi:hypothetical protein